MVQVYLGTLCVASSIKLAQTTQKKVVYDVCQFCLFAIVCSDHVFMYLHILCNIISVVSQRSIVSLATLKNPG
jgi:hypothetical protein